jgi:hypothetical protein
VTPYRKLRRRLRLAVAATASGSGSCCRVKRREQGAAEGRQREQRREGGESREQRREGGGSRVVVAAASLTLCLSSLFICGGWLGLRGGCSWAS